MAAFDHKGHCVYANTPLASMLGYTLKVLRTKDITQLMAQPFGVMHLKYLKVCLWPPVMTHTPPKTDMLTLNMCCALMWWAMTPEPI